MSQLLDQALGELPLIAILRGMEPVEAVDIGDSLFAAGFRVIEVPMNSPEPLSSIRMLRQRFGESVVVGAGTVLSCEDVHRVAEAGGQLIVSPNVDTKVVRTTLDLGLAAMPGFLSPTEAIAAIRAGCVNLKLFPASAYGPDYVKALRAVLPEEINLFGVGGIGKDEMLPWLNAGINGFGIGSELYMSGRSAKRVRRVAEMLVAQWSEASKQCNKSHKSATPNQA